MEITLPGAEQFVNMCLKFAFMHFSKKQSAKSADYALTIRIVFIISVLIQILILLYIKNRISKLNCQKTFKYKPTASMLSISDTADTEIEITSKEYDNNEVTSMLRSLALQSVFYLAISWKFGMSQSMLMMTFGLVNNLIFSPLYRAYIYGLEIERPYEKNLLFPKRRVAEVTPVTASTTANKKKKKEE